MKKLLSLLLSAALCFGAVSHLWNLPCIAEEAPAQQETQQEENQDDDYPVTLEEKHPDGGSDC